MDIASWLREVRMSTNTSDWNAAFVNNRLDEAANEIEKLREDNFKMWTILCDKPYGEIAHKAANEIERLREALREISCTCDTHCRFDGFELCDQWVARAALKEGE